MEPLLLWTIFLIVARFTWWPAILAYKPTIYPAYIFLRKIPSTESNYITPIYSAHTKGLYGSFVILTCSSMYWRKWSDCSLFGSSQQWNLIKMCWVNTAYFIHSSLITKHFVCFSCFSTIYCRQKPCLSVVLDGVSPRTISSYPRVKLHCSNSYLRNWFC